MPLRRTQPLPESVKSALAGARPLAWATDSRGITGVATAGHLALVDAAGTAREIPWTMLDGAEWTGEGATLELREVDGDTVSLHLPQDPRRFTQAVRERIQASLVHEVQRVVPGGGRVRAAIRRGPAGELTSQVSVLGTARRDGAVSDLAAQVEAEARAAVGLPT